MILIFFLLLILSLERTSIQARRRHHENTKHPTTSAQLPCVDLKTTAACNSHAAMNCQWFKFYACDPDTGICSIFDYGCQNSENFCNLNKGTVLQQIIQCNQRGYPCKFSDSKNSCEFLTNAPTINIPNSWTCFNTCFWAFNGVCDVSMLTHIYYLQN